MSAVKLLAVDLDGTCLDKRDTLRPVTLAALQRAMDAGVTVVPTTGRNLNGIPAALRALPGIRWCITSNGAAVYDLAEDRAVFERSIPCRRAAALLERCAVFGAPESVTVGKDVIDCDDEVYRIRHTFFHDYADSLFTDDLPAYVRARGEDAAKLHVLYLGRYDGTPIHEMLRHEPDITFSGDVHGHTEIVAAGVDKGAALQWLCERLDILPEAVAAIGDSDNDLQMLRFAGLPIAMGNAPAHIKAVAKFETLDCDHDGVAAAVAKLI